MGSISLSLAQFVTTTATKDITDVPAHSRCASNSISPCIGPRHVVRPWCQMRKCEAGAPTLAESRVHDRVCGPSDVQGIFRERN
jgi:hypothetical protein